MICQAETQALVCISLQCRIKGFQLEMIIVALYIMNASTSSLKNYLKLRCLNMVLLSFSFEANLEEPNQRLRAFVRNVNLRSKIIHYHLTVEPRGRVVS